LSDLVEIGRLVKLHGLKGRLKAISYLESETLLGGGRLVEVIVRPEKGPGKAYRVKEVRPQHKSFFIEFEGIDDPDSAARLVGSGIFIPAGLLEKLPEDEYYWHQIIGLRVTTQAGEYLGEISSILPTGSNEVYVVTGDGKEILLPAIEDVIKKIDLEKGEMIVVLPEGL
jgi:16S rRNA processing protein RimM